MPKKKVRQGKNFKLTKRYLDFYCSLPSEYWSSHADVKIVKWIQARDNEHAESFHQTVDYLSEESEPETCPVKPKAGESASNSEESEGDSDEEIITTNQNKFAVLLPDD